jgi:UDP-N-acetylmuramoylalanine--D-glutamate ligase
VKVFDQQPGGEALTEEDVATHPDALWVVSPGFAADHPWCEWIRSAGGFLIPELEYGWGSLVGETVIVTGSLGKTSMVLFAAELLRKTGRTVTVSGNIGTPVSQTALEHPVADVHVLEASSFQLETLQKLHPQRAVCLNLFPNHLDRHGTMTAYARAKARLFLNMGPDDTAAWPQEYPVSVSTRVKRKIPDPDKLPRLEGTPFARGPLRENLAMLMAILEDLSGISPGLVEEAVREFRFPAHRLQELEVPGMGRVIDDSKSTCFQATRAAVEMVEGRVHLIMGGLDKGQDPSELTRCFVQRNPRIYLFGAAGKKMQQAWQDSVDVCVCEDSLEGVMNVLFSTRTTSAEPVLFSPGCSSFDQFTGFAERGDHFQNLFRRMAEEHPLQHDFNPGTL